MGWGSDQKFAVAPHAKAARMLWHFGAAFSAVVEADRYLDDVAAAEINWITRGVRRYDVTFGEQSIHRQFHGDALATDGAVQRSV